MIQQFMSPENPPKPQQIYQFQGQNDLEKVQFNYKNTIQFYNAIVKKINENISQNPDLSEYFSQIGELFTTEVSKTVCAKIITNGQVIAECYDCRADSSCIICMQCFKNSNHEGHKVVFKKAYGGCCDCGDDQAWKPEGFCTKHSGKAEDIDIDDNIIKEFVKIFEDLFYLYFRFCIKKSQSKARVVIFSSLVVFVTELVEKGLHFTKLFSLVLNHKINKDRFLINQKINERDIFSNLLSYDLVSHNMKQWQEIFILMFPYYEFKKSLLSHYFANYSSIYTSSNKSYEIGLSISCQISTSYKLIQDYASNEANNELGYNFKDVKQKQLENIFAGLLTDVRHINNLQGQASQKYWAFHIKKGGVKNFLVYYEVMKNSFKKQQKKLKQEEKSVSKSPSLKFLVHSSKNMFYEFKMVESFLQITNKIAKNEEVLLQLIKKLFNFICLDYQEQVDFIIFRPYERIFSFALFRYFNYNLQNITEKQEQRQKLIAFLGTSEEDFSYILNKIFKKLIRTHFFFSLVTTSQNKGYHSSFYYYLYYYKVKNRLLSCIDIILLKIVLILNKKCKTEIDFSELVKIYPEDQYQWNPNQLAVFFEEMGLIYHANFCQIYLCHYEAKEQNQLYHQNILKYLSKYITEQGESLSLEKISQFSKNFLFDDEVYLKKYLREICDYNKEKKLFTLKNQFKDDQNINFKDYFVRSNITNKQPQQHPSKSLQFMGDLNSSIFNQIWNQKHNIIKLLEIVEHIYSKSSLQQTNEDISSFINTISYFYYLMRYHHNSFLQIFDKFFKRIVVNDDIIKNINEVYCEMLLKIRQIQGQFSFKSSITKDSQQKSKKEQLKAKKMKKMLQLKKKMRENTKIFQQKYSQQGEKSIQQLQKQISDDYCAICRKQKDENSHFVIIAKLNIRDHEKLLQIGQGVSTISFTSCYHNFDYQCMQKTATASGNMVFFNCPVCRKSGNIFFPLDPNSSTQQGKTLLENTFDRILQVIFSIRNYSSLNPTEELLKSVYHYVLLGLFDLQYAVKKRKKMIQIVIQILKDKLYQQEIKKLRKLFLDNKMNLRPKMVEKNKNKKVILSNNLFQQNEDDSSQEEYEEDRMQQLLSILAMFQNNPQPNLNILQNQITKEQVQKGMQSLSLKKKKTERQELKSSNIFRYTISSLFEEITSQKFEQTLFDEPLPQVVLILEDLLGIKDISTEISGKMKSKILKLRQLPLKYYWDTKDSTCDYCSDNSGDLMICLLCNWKGCLNCPKGGVNSHLKQSHGEVTAYMRKLDACLYVFYQEAHKKVGCLYLNEWGEAFNIKKDWNQYEFNEAVYTKAKNMLIKDEI